MKTNYIIDRQGNKQYLDKLPLVAYQLYCGHYGKEYGVKRYDLIFCKECQEDVKIRKVLAS